MFRKLIQLGLIAAVAQPAVVLGASAVAPPSGQGATTAVVTEFFNASLNHYFMTASAAEIAALDSGKTPGWTRTGATFTVYAPGSTQGTPVCRFYGRPEAGLDSHFYSGSSQECEEVKQRFAKSWTLESTDVFQVVMPDPAGACPAGTSPVYRVFNNRSDANHRYTADTVTRATMIAAGYVSEGNGADGVAFCDINAAASAPGATAKIIVTPVALDTFDFSTIAVASSGAQIASYVWNFGDGNVANGATATHQYLQSGTFPVVLTVTDSKGKTASASSQIVAAVATPGSSSPTPNPAGGPTPPGTGSGNSTGTPSAPPVQAFSGTERVRASFGGTNWTDASKQLGAKWTTPGGDWLDANGVFDGPTPTISQRVSTGPVSIDISGIDGDLLVQGLSGWDKPMIDGAPATAFWTDSSSAVAQALPARWNRPGIILNPNHGHTLQFTPAAGGQTVRIDRVAGPVIPDLPMIGASNKPDVLDVELTDQASILKAIGTGNYAVPWAYNPEFRTDPQTGLKYLRFSSADGPRLISWFMKFQPREEAYARYCLYIEDDVADGMTELGVKLPGLGNTPSDELISWRMEHGPVAPNNRGVYSFVDYQYDAESGNGFGAIHSMGGAMLKAGQWYVIEQRAKLNTPGSADGVGEIFLNGNLVWSSHTKRFRNSAATRLTNLHVNVYHGGTKTPSHPIHYRIAKIAVSSSYIGIPKELAPAQPKWRAGLHKDTIYPIAKTANLDGVWAQGNGSSMESNVINAWNGLAAGPTTWWAAANGGHDQGNGNGWENKVYKIDLAADKPMWTLVHPGSPRTAVTAADHYADGLPTSRHTYYSSQYIASRNRIMLFGAAAPYSIGFPAPAFQAGANVDGFDVSAKKWDPAGTYANSPVFNTAMSVAKDPATDDVYVAARAKFAKWSAATNTWSNVSPKGINGSYSSYEFKPSLIDSARHRWVHLADKPAPMLQFIDLATSAYSQVALTGPLTSVEDYSSLVHDLDNDRYITVQGAVMYAIDPVTGASSVIGSVPKAVNGAQNRLAYFQQVGGVAYLPQFSSDILFLPTR
jgi:hypothetical protein